MKRLRNADPSPVATCSLALNGERAYFGFWWSAANPQNSIEFLAKGEVLGTFSSAILAALGPGYEGTPTGRVP